MDALRQWDVSLIICGIGATVISLLSPRGTMEKTLRAVIGIFIVTTVCAPLANLKKAEDILPAFSFEGEAYYSDSLEEQMLAACKNTVGEVVENVAEEMGIAEYDVNTNIQIDEEYCIIIQDIHIVVYGCDSAVAADFEAVLQNKLGVSVAVERR